jgi:hypothetical protein
MKYSRIGLNNRSVNTQIPNDTPLDAESRRLYDLWRTENKYISEPFGLLGVIKLILLVLKHARVEALK